MAHVMMRSLPPTQARRLSRGKAEGTADVNGPAADKVADDERRRIGKSSDTAQTAAMAVIGGAESDTENACR